jgi:ABC-type transport system substrate-binding protein
MSTTFQGKYEGMAVGPFSISWEPHSNLYGMYVPEQARNSGHVTDAKMLALLREEMRTKDLAARKKLVLELQRHAAEQQYYVYLYSLCICTHSATRRRGRRT